MLGVEEQRVVDTVWGGLCLEVMRFGQRSPMSAAEHALVDKALFWLRQGVEVGDTAALDAATWLEAALGDLGPAFFELRLVDEVGQAVSGIAVQFAVGGAVHEVPTNAAGVALLDDAQGSTAVATVPHPKPLEETLDPRWQKPRRGAPPKEGNTTEVVFEGAPLPPVRLKAALPNTLVLKPPVGQLFLELWDKSGRIRHSGAAYEVHGPENFSGKTDEKGRLRHRPVFPGDYSLELIVTFTSGEETRTDTFRSPLVVLPSSASRPEIRMLGAVPLSVMVRLRLFFDTNKTFLLPTAFPGMRELRRLYLQNNPSKLLVRWSCRHRRRQRFQRQAVAGSIQVRDRLSEGRRRYLVEELRRGGAGRAQYPYRGRGL
ncbi:MAG: hypothetical protein K0R38_7041 [Polyangiaceae bacterium]|nr:hypothetical protein [Polyangiaceae bacterium]